MVTDRSDRAQLILVGAIALAFIILGLVVVFNGVLYTQTISSGNDLDEANSAQKGALEVERGIRGVVQRINVQNDTDDNSTIESAVEENITAFADGYSGVSSRSSGHITDVESSGSWMHGRIVGQESQDVFTNESDSWEWNVYNDTTDRREVRHFEVTINATESNDLDNFTVELSNSSTSETIDFTDPGNGNVSLTDCSEEFDTRADDTVTFDFSKGTVNGKSTTCDLRLSEFAEGPYEQVRFVGGGDAEGTYEIVFAGGDNSDGFDITPGAAVLEFDVDYQFASGGVTYERTLEVDVYGGDE